MSDSNEHKITIVEGNSEDLNISPVYTHLNVEKPKTNSSPNKNIIIPKENKNRKKKKK